MDDPAYGIQGNTIPVANRPQTLINKDASEVSDSRGLSLAVRSMVRCVNPCFPYPATSSLISRLASVLALDDGHHLHTSDSRAGGSQQSTLVPELDVVYIHTCTQTVWTLDMITMSERRLPHHTSRLPAPWLGCGQNELPDRGCEWRCLAHLIPLWTLGLSPSTIPPFAMHEGCLHISPIGGERPKFQFRGPGFRGTARPIKVHQPRSIRELTWQKSLVP